MKKVYPAALLSLFACLHAAPALTSEEASQQSTMQDEMVVTASRVAESIKDVSANINIIDREEIEQSVSRNVGDLLAEKAVGVIRKYPGNLTSIGIRGFRTDTHGNDLQGKVLVLRDGRRAGTGNVAKLLTKNVERIEIIRGPGAVQYGSAGVGGVINVITRQGKDNSLFVDGGFGSFDYWEGNVGGTVNQNGFDFAGSYTYLTYDDYDTGSGDSYPNTGVDYENGLSANLGYSFSELNRIGVIVNAFNADGAGSSGYFSDPDLDNTADKKNYSVDAMYTGGIENDQYQWMARYFFGKDENEYFDPVASNPSGWDDGIPSFNNSDQQGIQAQTTATYDFATMTVGFDWVDYDVDNFYAPQKTSYSNPALFFLGKSSFFNDTLTFNLGLRYDWYSVEVNEPAGRDEDQNNFTPKIGLSWLATDNLKFRAQYAEAFVMPSAQQLASDYVLFGRRTVGNPDLDPETSNTYEGGVDYFYNSLTASLTYFHSDYEDKIVADYLPEGSSSWQNLGDATIAGFEVEIGYDIGEAFDWSWEVRPYLGMTLLTEYEDNQTGEDLLFTNDTNLAAGIVASNGAGTFVRFNVNYTGDQEVQDWESGLFPAPVVELESSTVADLSAAYRFYESETYGAFTVRGEIRNLFDEEYAYVNGYPMPGINYFVGLRWDY